jgi:hypothetical protein
MSKAITKEELLTRRTLRLAVPVCWLRPGEVAGHLALSRFEFRAGCHEKYRCQPTAAAV